MCMRSSSPKISIVFREDDGQAVRVRPSYTRLAPSSRAKVHVRRRNSRICSESWRSGRASTTVISDRLTPWQWNCPPYRLLYSRPEFILIRTA